jgi:hypothetical protein
MDYRRYSLGSYARNFWIECNECGTANEPHYVFQRSERAVNLAEALNLVMHHEIAAHISNPTTSVIKRK